VNQQRKSKQRRRCNSYHKGSLSKSLSSCRSKSLLQSKSLRDKVSQNLWFIPKTRKVQRCRGKRNRRASQCRKCKKGSQRRSRERQKPRSLLKWQSSPGKPGQGSHTLTRLRAQPGHRRGKAGRESRRNRAGAAPKRGSL